MQAPHAPTRSADDREARRTDSAGERSPSSAAATAAAVPASEPAVAAAGAPVAAADVAEREHRTGDRREAGDHEALTDGVHAAHDARGDDDGRDPRPPRR
jgi:hypothetical protein